MIHGYKIFDADAHVMMSPAMWQDLPQEYAFRRPRPLELTDTAGAGVRRTGWLIEGRMEPHAYGPGAQGANTPTTVMPEFGAPQESLGSADLSDPHKRLRDLDKLGIDSQLLFPSSLYACMGSNSFFEAAMFRAYNRYAGRQCKTDPHRLKWAGLLPLRDQREAIAALHEMQQLGASAAWCLAPSANGCCQIKVLRRSGMNSPAPNYRSACTWGGVIRPSINWSKAASKPM